MRRFLLLAVTAWIAMVIGCASNRPWKPVKVTGKITYEDGSIIPVGSMKLYFVPQAEPIDAKTFPRQGAVGVNVSDGTFADVTTYKYGDGLIPGKHKVVVAAYDANSREFSAKIPKEYTVATTTPLEVDTKDVPFEIKVPKPKGNR